MVRAIVFLILLILLVILVHGYRGATSRVMRRRAIAIYDRETGRWASVTTPSKPLRF